MKEDGSELLATLFEPDKEPIGSLPSSELTERIIGCAYKVSNSLGCGFLERVYENSLAHELRKAGLQVTQQQKIDVLYDGIIVDTTRRILSSMVVSSLKLRQCGHSKTAHKAQCLNYLKATGIRLCLLINFGSPRVEVKRVAL